MKCPKCGSELPEANRFCTNCGAPLGEDTVQMPSVTSPPPPSPPQPPPTQVVPPVSAAPPPTETPPPARLRPTAGAASTRGTGSNRVWMVLVIVLGFIVMGGAVVGVIAWRVAAGNKPVAAITGLELTRADGKKLDLDRVPLDVDLELQATFRAKYKEGGSATLKLFVEDSGGNEIFGDSYRVKSSGDLQKKTLEFHMTWSEGKPLEAKADLKVTQGSSDVSDTSTLSYRAVKGKGKEAALEEAVQDAREKLDEAAEVVEVTGGMGIEVGDLFEMLDDASASLEDATTVDEADGAYHVGVEVIEECERRQAKQRGENDEAEVCRSNQTEIRDLLWLCYDEEGDFPDSMSDLGDLPVCPSGGTYSYEADLSSDPPTLRVECSVHGVLLPGI